MSEIEKLMIEAERESFIIAAKRAKEHNTKLVFEEDGKIIHRSPTEYDLTGEGLELIDLN